MNQGIDREEQPSLMTPNAMQVTAVPCLPFNVPAHMHGRLPDFRTWNVQSELAGLQAEPAVVRGTCSPSMCACVNSDLAGLPAERGTVLHAEPSVGRAAFTATLLMCIREYLSSSSMPAYIHVCVSLPCDKYHDMYPQAHAYIQRRYHPPRQGS
jgi:hypothetical protein